jgi:hypothetical protein
LFKTGSSKAVDSADNRSVAYQQLISTETIECVALALDYFISQAIALIASTEDTLESLLLKLTSKSSHKLTAGTSDPPFHNRTYPIINLSGGCW